MTRLRIYPIIHRNQERIALEIDRYIQGSGYDLITRNLPERLYSKTKGLWHIPFRHDYQQWVPEQYNLISDLEFVFPDSSGNVPPPADRREPAPISNSVLIKIDTTNRRFYVDHGYNPDLFATFNQLKKGIWLSKQKNWAFAGKNELYKQIVEIIKTKGFNIEKTPNL